MSFLNIALTIGLGAFVAGYQVADWRLTGKATAETLERTQAAVNQRDEALAAYTHVAGVLAAKNDLHLQELRIAQNETNTIRDRVSAGAVGLRVPGTCKPSPLQQVASGPLVDSGTGAELDATARQAYFALRDGIDRASTQLAACQDELRGRQ